MSPPVLSTHFVFNTLSSIRLQVLVSYVSPPSVVGGHRCETILLHRNSPALEALRGHGRRTQLGDFVFRLFTGAVLVLRPGTCLLQSRASDGPSPPEGGGSSRRPRTMSEIEIDGPNRRLPYHIPHAPVRSPRLF